MQRRDEISLCDAADLLETPQESLYRLAEEGKLKSRRAGGDLYFLREESESLHGNQVEELRAQVSS
jgi:hypothetical protein